MTLIYELDLYFLKVYILAKDELSKSRISKVIVLHTYVLTYNEADVCKHIGLYHAVHATTWVVNEEA